MADWTSTDQWRRVGNTEGSENDGLDVRSVVDIGRGLNNLHDYVLADRLCFGAIGGPLITNDAGATTEMMVMFLGGPWFIADGYRSVRYWINTERVAGAGYVDWKIVLGRSPLYVGNDEYSSALVPGEVTASIRTSSNDKVIATGTLNIKYINDQRVWGYLTAANEDVTSQACVWSLDMMLEA